MNNIVKNFSKEDEKIKFIRQKSLDARKHDKKDDMHLINIDIKPIVKNTDFLNNGLYLDFGDRTCNININKSIQETNLSIIMYYYLFFLVKLYLLSVKSRTFYKT